MSQNIDPFHGHIKYYLNIYTFYFSLNLPYITICITTMFYLLMIMLNNNYLIMGGGGGNYDYLEYFEVILAV